MPAHSSCKAGLQDRKLWEAGELFQRMDVRGRQKTSVRQKNRGGEAAGYPKDQLALCGSLHIGLYCYR